MAKSTEDYGVYFARGVIIILMVYGHVDYVGYAESTQQEIFNYMHAFRMPVLILFSGFFLRDGKASNTYLRTAVRNVAIPYVIFEILYLFAHYLGNVSGMVPVNSGSVGGWWDGIHAVLLDPHGPFWFLRDLFIVYVSYIFLSAASRQYPTSLVWVFPAALVTLGLLGVISIEFSVFFTLGYWGRKLFGSFPRSSFSIALFAVGLSLLHYTNDFENYLIKIWVSLSAALALVAIGDFLSHTSLQRGVAICGKYSIHILCWHAFFVAALRPFSDHLLSIEGSGLLYSVLSTSVGVLLSLLMKYSMDRLRLTGMVFGTRLNSRGTPSYTPVDRSKFG